MKARYIASADPTEDQSCDVFGLTFARDKWVTVSDEIGARLTGNPAFEVKGDSAPTDPDPAADPQA